MDRTVRRAALIATAVTVPLVVIVGLVLGSVFSGGGGKSDPAAPVTASAPPHADRFAQACTTLLTALPVRLEKLAPRRVVTTPASPFVVAWGDPAIVVRCGVDRPAGFGPTSTRQVFPGGTLAGAWYWVDRAKGANVYTAIDRAAYVSFTLPDAYQGADYLPVLNTAVLKAFPKAACSTSQTELDASKLCANRKD